MAAVMSSKRPRALTGGIDSVGSMGSSSRVSTSDHQEDALSC